METVFPMLGICSKLIDWEMLPESEYVIPLEHSLAVMAMKFYILKAMQLRHMYFFVHLYAYFNLVIYI